MVEKRLIATERCIEVVEPIQDLGPKHRVEAGVAHAILTYLDEEGNKDSDSWRFRFAWNDRVVIVAKWDATEKT